MADSIGGGTNSRPLDDTIAGTGPGIPDDALGPDRDLPSPPSDAEVAEVARHMGAQVGPASSSLGTAELNPGDEARPGTEGTGEDVCRTCNGTGQAGGGECPTCGGSGIVIEGIGGG